MPQANAWQRDGSHGGTEPSSHSDSLVCRFEQCLTAASVGRGGPQHSGSRAVLQPQRGAFHPDLS